MSALFVTGTDTNVGKTFVSCALIAALHARGRRVTVMKPIETGVESEPLDALALRAAAADPAPLEVICPVRLRAPLAPSVAARLEGRTLDPEWLVRQVPYTRVEQALRAAAASPADAEALHLDPGAPLFVIERTTWRGGDALTHVRLSHPGEGFRIVARDGF